MSIIFVFLSYRYNLFKENVVEINRKNKDKNRLYKSGINKFTDLSSAEFQWLLSSDVVLPHNKLLPFKINQKENYINDDNLDWREKGYVTRVKDQGDCGSCWAFATTGSIEAFLVKNNESLTSLSEAQLMDCTNSYGNMDCFGGNVIRTYRYLIHNRKMCTEEQYPYIGIPHSCHSSNCSIEIPLKSYRQIWPGDENLKAAVQIQPIPVSLNANPLRDYQSGIFNMGDECQNLPNHAVLVVGYGSEDGHDYWLVKNSWGESYGEEG